MELIRESKLGAGSKVGVEDTHQHPCQAILHGEVLWPLPCTTLRKPLHSGHSAVNILFGSSVIKRTYASAKMLEAPCGEGNIIISLSSFCTRGPAELLRPPEFCSQSPRQGKAAGNTAQKRVPRSLDAGWRERHLTHAHPVSVHSQHALHRAGSDLHSSLYGHRVKRYYSPTLQMMRWVTCTESVSQLVVGHQLRAPAGLVASCLL